MKTFSIAFVALLSLSAVTGCKKKGGGGDINATCEDVFAHAEKDGGKWSAGKGDKKAFMDFCVTQKPEVVRCSSMEIEMDDKDIKRANEIAAYPWFKGHKGWQKEIAKMLSNGFKMEVESLINKDISYVTEVYVPERLQKKDWLE